MKSFFVFNPKSKIQNPKLVAATPRCGNPWFTGSSSYMTNPSRKSTRARRGAKIGTCVGNIQWFDVFFINPKSKISLRLRRGLTSSRLAS
jgi:hypothetical protein